ncbi:unnamed protein product, partial [Allacma fusca]
LIQPDHQTQDLKVLRLSEEPAIIIGFLGRNPPMATARLLEETKQCLYQSFPIMQYPPKYQGIQPEH